MEKLHLTNEGLDKLKSELAASKERTAKVAAALERARALGDLRENAEYHAAKEEQALLQARIHDLQDKIARASVVDESRIDASKAYLGATVRVLNKKLHKEFTYTLMSPVEADMGAGKISIKSPVGQALAGKSAGDVVVARVPAGNIEFEILEVTR